MQTYSHAIFNTVFGKQMERRGVRPMYSALLVGSLVPDLPLTVLTIDFVMRNGGFGRPPQEMFGPAYDAMYFSDPTWIIGHSLFHAPLMIAVWLFVGWYFGFWRGQTWGKWFFWFAVGNGLHSLFDIVTHHNDGPLLLFPLEWTVRFQSPISYWDPDHYGLIVAPIEHGLDLIFIAYLIYSWWTNRRAQASEGERRAMMGRATDR